MQHTTNYNLKKPEGTEYVRIQDLNDNADIIDSTLIALDTDKASNTDLTNLQNDLTSHKEQYEYQTATVSGTQIRLTKQSTSNRLLFKLESDLSGSITVSTDGGTTSKNLVDIDGEPVTSIDKGFHEIVLTGNFFILRNKGGLSKADLEALIAITNEAEANESVLRTNYVNAVNDADESINLPSGATWNDILLQIPNINASRVKFYEGVTTTANHKSVSLGYANGNAVTMLCAQIDVNIIGFEPDIIIGYHANGSSPMISTWFSHNYQQSSTTIYTNAYNWSQGYRAPKVGDIINLPLTNGSTSQPFKFYAFKFNS